MNIEQMAREAGCTYKIGESFVHFGLHDGVPMPWLERFAALVRADERKTVLTELRQAIDMHESLDSLRFSVDRALKG